MTTTEFDVALNHHERIAELERRVVFWSTYALWLSGLILLFCVVAAVAAVTR